MRITIAIATGILGLMTGCANLPQPIPGAMSQNQATAFTVQANAAAPMTGEDQKAPKGDKQAKPRPAAGDAGKEGLCPNKHPKADGAKGDQVKADGAKGDQAKVDGPKGDQAKADGPKGDQAKADGPKGDNAKAGGLKGNNVKDDQARADGPKGDKPIKTSADRPAKSRRDAPPTR
ncbi:MAG: hypothetical protein H7338_22760 [Candidatus Sericytochromatia bacterium]|nr:hypothetical protein [Candidatus Sericytochromatia bacterium]